MRLLTREQEINKTKRMNKNHWIDQYLYIKISCGCYYRSLKSRITIINLSQFLDLRKNKRLMTGTKDGLSTSKCHTIVKVTLSLKLL